MGPKSVTPAVVPSAPLDIKSKLAELKQLKDDGLIDERTWQIKTATVLEVAPPPSASRAPLQSAAGEGELSLEDSSTAAERKLASLARSLNGSPEEPLIRGVLWQAVVGKAERRL